MIVVRAVFALGCALALSSCATHPVEAPHERAAPNYALPSAPDGAFADLESVIRSEHGVDASGFMLLDRNQDGLRWRLALIDSARHSIDAQYYIWYADATGDLLIKRLLDAADRGVKVRLLVDDLNTVMAEATKVQIRDKGAALVNAHPNLELRLFNAWTQRSLGGRVTEMATDTSRLNYRMPNKVMIVDNQATIIGGRNIGDDYMGLHEDYNFHDLDVLKTLHERHVKVSILTNSLASHDVPAVNSHYKKWRKPIIETGAELFEIRHDAAIQPLVADTPPTHAEFMGLHSKGMVVDRERVFIGSMNFDPRSSRINSEMGVVVESRDLADALAQNIERDLLPTNSWHVELDQSGKLRWTNDRESVTRQPARSWWQRVEDVIFMAFPRDLY